MLDKKKVIKLKDAQKAQENLRQDYKEWNTDFSAKNNPAQKHVPRPETWDSVKKSRDKFYGNGNLLKVKLKNPVSYAGPYNTITTAESTSQVGEFMNYHDMADRARMTPKQRVRKDAKLI